MVGELITLPLRLTGLAARIWWRTAEQAVSLASDAAGYVIQQVSPDGSDHQGPEFEPYAPSESYESTGAPSRPVAEEHTPPARPLAEPRMTAARPPVPVQEPRHVSEEPELVEELAEPGAEEGAGAEVHVDEPWDGYRDMNAREVTDRLARASTAELAAVQLYEASNRGRQTILAAAARQMRSANGSGSRT